MSDQVFIPVRRSSLYPANEDEESLTASVDQQKQLLETLGKATVEAKSAQRYLKTNSVISLANRKIDNYNAVRTAYRLKYKEDQPIGFFDTVLLVIDIRTYYYIAKRFVSSKGFNIFISILDLLSDIFFCILYLFDIQWALSHLDDLTLATLPGPSWLWISRLPVTFGACIWFSLFNLFSWILEVAFADNKAKSFFSLLSFINVITVLPFVFSIHFEEARFLYIPYFLRSIVAIDRLRKVLRLRGALGILNFSAVMEKVVILLGTLLVIFYFVVVTLSTVGYGDISPSTKGGQVVVILLIMTALTVLPSLISSLLSTLAEQQIGKGEVFTRGKASYVVVVGHFETTNKIMDALDGLLHEQSKKEKVVFLARTPITPQVHAVITSYKYKDRVIYLVASGMEKSDLNRAQIRHASAVYIISDRGAPDHRREDEKNTLRAWAIHNYAPEVPLFVNNLLPDTESYQEMNADGSLCIDDLKQLVLALTVMYDGASAFLINLLHISSPNSQYDTLWEAQYGDGFGNEIFVVPNNPLFAGLLFNTAAWIVFSEFQINMIGVRIHDTRTGGKWCVLNPGKEYRLGSEDHVIFLAQNDADVQLFSDLTQEFFQAMLLNHGIDLSNRSTSQTTVLNEGMGAIKDSRLAPPTPSVSLARVSATLQKVAHRRASIPELSQYASVLDIPEAPYSDSCVPQCRLVAVPADLDDLMVDCAVDWEGHLLVCTGDYDVFKFVCGLRASHLPEHHRILFLAERMPTRDEYEVLSVFPEINYMVGDPRQKKVLMNAGIRGCSKVVIMKMGSYGSGEFAGSSSIMISHLIYHMHQRHEIDHEKCVILEAPRRNLINYLHPTPTSSSVSYRRYLRAAIKKVGKSVGLPSKQGTATATLKAREKNIPGEVEYFYTPVFAAGRVIAASMLDSLLFQLHKNPCLFEIILLLCGVQQGVGKGERVQLPGGAKNSWIGQIPVPIGFENRTFGELYQELSLNHGIVPLGVYRKVNDRLHNKLPFVFTNPLPGVLLM
ncbi:UNVERIFIED_CONTAM: potassium channel, sub T, member 2 [Siphonaria sp. JEL0065]|nr:potassium channel, sub T, member 2 [Siphonaria sp. JEL0065]